MAQIRGERRRLASKRLDDFEWRHRRGMERCRLPYHNGLNRVGVERKQIHEKLVWRLRLDAKRFKRSGWEVAQITRDDEWRAARNGCCHDMAILRVDLDRYAADESRVRCHERVWKRARHRRNAPRNLLRLLPKVVDECALHFVENIVGPAEAIESGRRSAEQKVAQGCGYEDTGVHDDSQRCWHRCDASFASHRCHTLLVCLVQPYRLIDLSKLIERLLTGCVTLGFILHQVVEADSPMGSRPGIGEASLIEQADQVRA